MELTTFVQDVAAAMGRVDRRAPQASSARGDRKYQPGIGPHSEDQTVALVMEDLDHTEPTRYAGRYTLQIPYPAAARSGLDIAIGQPPSWSLCVEVKMLRMMGDNGRPNDNMLMHILSPYPAHRSALTDTEKLLRSGFTGPKAILIYAYEYPAWPSLPAIEAFQTLASRRVKLPAATSATVSGLIHPVHRSATVYGWLVEEL
jgi:hypothetical protein